MKIQNEKSVNNINSKTQTDEITAFFGETIFVYTSEMATDDGILFALDKLQLRGPNIFSHVTTNLLNQGYLTNDKVNVPNLLDLLNQALNIIRKSGVRDWMYSGDIETPEDEEIIVYICQNETARYTIMLPSDY
jgi:hypothetical protein